MAALTGLVRGQRQEFVRLRSIVHTEGNLGTHIATPERAGYILVERDFNGRAPESVLLTAAGRCAFTHYVSYLRPMLDGERTATIGKPRPMRIRTEHEGSDYGVTVI